MADSGSGPHDLSLWVRLHLRAAVSGELMFSQRGGDPMYKRVVQGPGLLLDHELRLGRLVYFP